MTKMNAHSSKEFDEFMNQLQETNRTLDFYCDFDKIDSNVRAIELKLNTLNYLIGKEKLDESIKEIWQQNSEVFDVLNILIAVRNQNEPVWNNHHKLVSMSSYWKSVDGVIDFINDTGLADLFHDKKIKNLVDYVFGVETGLDTNARKNRSGKQMERAVAALFAENNIKFQEQCGSNNLPKLSVLGMDKKVFDFVIETKKAIYCVEVNFYSSGGSKLNEVARSYTDLSPKINAVKGFEFVWITDGIGWESASNKLEEAFYNIPNVYNLTSITNFIDQIKKEL